MILLNEKSFKLFFNGSLIGEKISTSSDALCCSSRWDDVSESSFQWWSSSKGVDIPKKW